MTNVQKIVTITTNCVTLESCFTRKGCFWGL